MKPFLIATTLLLAFAASFASVTARSAITPWRTAHYENVLGTSMEMKVNATSDTSADSAETAALGEIERLNAILSGYDPNSEFSRWARTRGEAVHISPELMEVLQLWNAWRARTGGALNPAAEAIARVWKRAETTGNLPAEKDMTAAAAAARLPQWRLDEASGAAMRLTDTPLILNSFTKSYIVERAAEAALRVPGVKGVVVNIGGDLVVRGVGTDRIDVTDPLSNAENSAPAATLLVAGRAVATSGNYRRGFEIGGKHYSHIVDPRTGHTAEGIVGATVVAPNAVDAGALATAFCVLSPEESKKLAASVRGAEYMLVASSGARYVSAGFPLAPAPQNKAAASAADAWKPGYELTVNVEIPQTQGFGARRPYVAIWIEDKDRYPVRTLAVLFDKIRWLNELRGWYRDDRLRAMSEGTEILHSVTSATRSPGKYTFKWDGKDNSGKPVKDGAYTVLVEAAREHGGDTLVRKELSFNGQPVEAELAPGGELGAVTLDYHKAAH